MSDTVLAFPNCTWWAHLSINLVVFYTLEWYLVCFSSLLEAVSFNEFLISWSVHWHFDILARLPKGLLVSFVSSLISHENLDEISRSGGQVFLRSGGESLKVFDWRDHQDLSHNVAGVIREKVTFKWLLAQRRKPLSNHGTKRLTLIFI